MKIALLTFLALGGFIAFCVVGGVILSRIADWKMKQEDKRDGWDYE